MEKIKVEMRPGRAHYEVVNLLRDRLYIQSLIAYCNGQAASEDMSPKGKAMFNDIAEVTSQYENEVLNRTASFLLACVTKIEVAHVAPILCFPQILNHSLIHEDEWGNELDEPAVNWNRLAQMAGVCITILHRIGLLGSSKKEKDPFGEIIPYKVVARLPEGLNLESVYALPKAWADSEIRVEEYVTGKTITKWYNHGLDKCLETLKYLSEPQLSICPEWRNKPEMLLDEGASNDERIAFEQYTQKLGAYITEAESMLWFRVSYIEDYRGRVYVTEDSVNFTNVKQIRSLLELWQKEVAILNGTLEDIDTSGIELPALPTEDIEEEEKYPF